MALTELRAGGALLRPMEALQVRGAKEDFGASLEYALFVQRNSPFWIGDLLLQAEAALGDDFYQQLDSGCSLEMIQRYVGVSRLVPKRNRVEGLSWSHHSYVAKVPVDKQLELLLYAKQEGLTSKQFATYVSERKRQWGSDLKETN